MTATAVEDEQELTVWVAHRPGGTRARYRLVDLRELHWDSVPAGPLPGMHRFLIHGYVFCDEMLNGALEHPCPQDSRPHRIKVCAVTGDNSRDVMNLLKAQAGPKPSRT